MAYRQTEKRIFNQALKTVEKTNLRLLNSFKDAKENVEAMLLKLNASIIKDGVIKPFKQERLKKLLREINANIDELSRQTGKIIFENYERVYSGTYYNNAFAFERAVNLEIKTANDYLLNVPPLDIRLIKQSFNEQIGEYVYRDRSIQIKSRMKYLIQEAVAKTIIEGESVQALSKTLKGVGEAFSSGLGNTTRIARTELLKAYSLGQEEIQKEVQNSGVQLEYFWDAALDSHTRPTHARADGQRAIIVNGQPVFNVGGIQFSSPRVPINPTGSKQEAGEVINCRCRRINVPYGIRPTERAARLPNGEWSRVNANITAGEWIKENYGKDYSE